MSKHRKRSLHQAIRAGELAKKLSACDLDHAALSDELRAKKMVREKNPCPSCGEELVPWFERDNVSPPPVSDCTCNVPYEFAPFPCPLHGHPTPETRATPTTKRWKTVDAPNPNKKLVSDAAEAVETFGEDELEKFAASRCAKCGRPRSEHLYGDGDAMVGVNGCVFEACSK